ncbi:hypothetical protein VTK56DRAFT_4251 [Thermocarpiscus australiensis]
MGQKACPPSMPSRRAVCSLSVLRRELSRVDPGLCADSQLSHLLRGLGKLTEAYMTNSYCTLGNSWHRLGLRKCQPSRWNISSPNRAGYSSGEEQHPAKTRSPVAHVCGFGETYEVNEAADHSLGWYPRYEQVMPTLPTATEQRARTRKARSRRSVCYSSAATTALPSVSPATNRRASDGQTWQNEAASSGSTAASRVGS